MMEFFESKSGLFDAAALIAVKVETMLSLMQGGRAFMYEGSKVVLRSTYSMDSGSQIDSITIISPESHIDFSIEMKPLGDKFLLDSTILSVNGETNVKSPRIHAYVGTKVERILDFVRDEKKRQDRGNAIRQSIYSQISSETTLKQAYNMSLQLAAVAI